MERQQMNLRKSLNESVKDIHEDDEIVLLADIVGGSPLTTALNVFS